MKKFFYGFILMITICTAFIFIGMTDKKTALGSDNCYVMDFDSGRVLYAKGENERKPIASMVKIMTLLLAFENIDSGKISFDQKVSISHEAARQTGSEMFLDEGEQYPVTDLIKGIVTMSANDASVAIAELIAGDENSFTNMMNERAKRLGMKDTIYSNATGLPTSEQQFSTAKDVSVVMRELGGHKEYYNYSTIWLEDYAHPSGRITQMANTNKLIRHYKGCDCGKTGYTDSAKYCLAASACRDGMRVVGAVLGVDNSKARFAAMSSLFNYCFNTYKRELLLKANTPISVEIKVDGGKKDKIEIVCEKDVAVLINKNEEKPKLQYNLPELVKAPIKKGDKIGEINAVVGGKKLMTIKVLANEDVGKASIWDYIKKIL